MMGKLIKDEGIEKNSSGNYKEANYSRENTTQGNMTIYQNTLKSSFFVRNIKMGVHFLSASL